MTPASSGTRLRADARRERGADTETLNVTPPRDERHVEQRREHHAENSADEEYSPLVYPDDPPPPSPPSHRLAIGREDEAAVGEVHFVTADRGGDVARQLPHAVALVSRPVRQGEVDDAAGPGVRHEGPQQEEVHLRRKEVERAARHVKTREAGHRRLPRSAQGRRTLPGPESRPGSTR